MKFKPQSIIIVLVIAWIIFIGWGVVKTTLQLSKQEVLLEESPLEKPEITGVTAKKNAC